MLRYIATAALVCVASLTPAAEVEWTPDTVQLLPIMGQGPCHDDERNLDGWCVVFVGPERDDGKEVNFVMFVLDGEPLEIKSVNLRERIVEVVWFGGFSA